MAATLRSHNRLRAKGRAELISWYRKKVFCGIAVCQPFNGWFHYTSLLVKPAYHRLADCGGFCDGDFRQRRNDLPSLNIDQCCVTRNRKLALWSNVQGNDQRRNHNVGPQRRATSQSLVQEIQEGGSYRLTGAVAEELGGLRRPSCRRCGLRIGNPFRLHIFVEGSVIFDYRPWSEVNMHLCEVVILPRIGRHHEGN